MYNNGDVCGKTLSSVDALRGTFASLAIVGVASVQRYVIVISSQICALTGCKSRFQARRLVGQGWLGWCSTAEHQYMYHKESESRLAPRINKWYLRTKNLGCDQTLNCLLGKPPFFLGL